MIRRFNFTNRKKLPQSLFDISVTSGSPREFNATFDLGGFLFPPEARLYFEASSSGSGVSVRFPWGTVAAQEVPAQRSLELIPGENVRFDFKVVDETEDTGRILGIARGISLRSGGDGRRSLLPVNPVPLGQQLWRLSFEQPDTPWLEVNDAVPDIMTRAQSDPVFVALVYPAVVREILLEAMIARGHHDPEDTSSWEGCWLSFAMRFHPDLTPPSESPELHREWIDQVVMGFCTHYSIRDRFSNAPYIGMELPR